MTLVRKDKPISRRRFLVSTAVGLGTIILALGKWPVGVWLVGTVVIVIMVAGFLLVPPTPTVNAAPESDKPLDCLSCHTKVLKFHDKLGSGNKACWVCHDNTDMKTLQLADETKLSLSDSPQLCGQCHQKRYDAWKEGVSANPGADKAKCADCHDPHQPQIVLLDITKPHPEAQPSPSPPSVELLVMLGISLLLVIIAIGVAVVKQGEET